MPALPAVPSVLRLRWLHTVGSNINLGCHQYWHYTGAAPTNADLVTLAGTMESLWATNLKPLAGTWVTLTECIAQDLTSSSAAIGTNSTTSTGTLSGSPLTAETAVLVNYVIARRYRGGKPRTYWPIGQPSNLTTAERWSGAAVTAFQTAFNAISTGLAAVTFSGGGTLNSQVNVSYYQGFTSYQNPVTNRWINAPKVRTTPVIDNITSSVVSAIPGSQRRRMRAT